MDVQLKAVNLFPWLALVLQLSCAPAVHTPRRHEVGFLTGRTPAEIEALPGTAANGEELELRSASTFQGYYAYRLTDYEKPVTLDLEVPFLAVPSREVSVVSNDLAIDYSALFVVPGLRARAEFPGTRIYVTGNAGAGWARFQEPDRLFDGAPNTRKTTVNTLGLGMGVGLGIQVSSVIDVRLEVRGVGAKRSLSFDNPDDWRFNSMGFFGGTLRF